MTRLGVRSTAALLAMIAVALVALLATIILTTTLRSSLIDEIDRSITDRADDIASQWESDNEFVVLGAGFDDLTMAAVFDGTGEYYAFTEESPESLDILDSFVAFDVPVSAEIDLDSTLGLDRVRGITLLVDSADVTEPRTAADFGPDDVIVFVGSSLEPVDSTVREITIGAAIAGPLFVLLVGALTWLLVGRALRPVEAMRTEVESISATGLDRRVPEPPSDDEIGRLAGTMNRMLQRLQRSQEAQQQFVADASHELRSPLASMAAILDVSERHGTDDEWPATAESLQRETHRMRRLVEDLLLLARADASGESAPDAAPERPATMVDLDDIVLDVAHTTDQRSTITIDTTEVSAGLIAGHPDQLRRVVINLIENAVRHAQAQVHVKLAERDGLVELAVGDDGAGIPAPDRERVFDRFVRLDDARARGDGGSGLGLAISAEIASSHGGSITIGTSHLGGAQFTLSLPAHP